MLLIITSFLLFGVISGLVVLISAKLTSNEGKPPPPNYDNRWPGYPKRPGDKDYDVDQTADLGYYL